MHTQITCPPAVQAYNKHIGGVDLADQMGRFTHAHTNHLANGIFGCFGFLVDLA